MKIEDKIYSITKWFSDEKGENVNQLVIQNNSHLIDDIEELIGERLTDDVRCFLEKFDGESGNGYGSFFGHSIMSIEEIMINLDFAKSQVKPENPVVIDPERSNTLIQGIIKSVAKELPLKKRWGFIKAKWFKVEFEMSPNSFGGPYFYRDKSTSNKEREIIELSENCRNHISNLTKQLHELELNSFNWDNLKIVAYGNDTSEVERSFFDFDNLLPLTSTPDKVIKKKYFHLKWIPLMSDFSGNYIGVDLDPDINGVKGQVIIFGRDEEDMIVLANSLEDFLDWNIELIAKGSEKLQSDSHLHDVYRGIKTF